MMKHPMRLWFYFRTGYSTYLTFLLSAINTLTIVYYLLVKNLPDLQAVFPKFSVFAIIAVAIGLPLGVLAGWLHIKRTPAWTAEVDIGVEANPYYYKLPPGWNKEVMAPLYLEILRQTTKILDSQGLLENTDKSRIRSLEEKMETLLQGGFVGQPRRKINF